MSRVINSLLSGMARVKVSVRVRVSVRVSVRVRVRVRVGVTSVRTTRHIPRDATAGVLGLLLYPRLLPDPKIRVLRPTATRHKSGRETRLGWKEGAVLFLAQRGSALRGRLILYDSKPAV